MISTPRLRASTCGPILLLFQHRCSEKQPTLMVKLARLPALCMYYITYQVCTLNLALGVYSFLRLCLPINPRCPYGEVSTRRIQPKKLECLLSAVKHSKA